MKRYSLGIFTVPKSGREREWDDWHRDQHVDEVLKISGFTACRRYRAAEGAPAAQPLFMAIYEIHTADIGVVMDDLHGRYGAPALPASPASDPSKSIAWLWEETSCHSRRLQPQHGVSCDPTLQPGADIAGQPLRCTGRTPVSGGK